MIGQRNRVVKRLATFVVMIAVVAAQSLVVTASSAAAATPARTELRVLLVGGPASGVTPDPTTAAWTSALDSEGVAYTVAVTTGAVGSETVALPALTASGDANHGLFNAIVVADSPNYFAAGQLNALFDYERTFAVRQLDGYVFPSANLGLVALTGGDLSGTTPTLTAAGLAALPALKGPVPIDTGSFGYPATVSAALPAGASFTPYLNDSAGHDLMGVYQHPIATGDPQSGVAELVMNFNYSPTMLHWLLLAPGLIDWVSQSTHLGLYRNYFGQDIDDVFIADNEWSSKYQCTPAATEPSDFTCPVGVANNPADTPADVLMSPADVAYVAAWEQKTGITLSLAFNAVGACTAPTASAANCSGSATVGGATYIDPGQVIDDTSTSAAATTNALLASQASFNWITHTWSHQFLGCIAWQAMPLTTVVANPTGGTLAAGGYTYEVTAATAYGESEPSLAHPATTAANGSVTLTWPEAPNGTGTNGTPGPTLAQEKASRTGGSGFWGYNIYRAVAGSTAFGLVGQVAEPATATPSSTYSFTDNGATAPGAAPESSVAFPTATNPGIGCANGTTSWEPATSLLPDASIQQEIGLDVAFAANNGLTAGTGLSNYSPATVVTGEHSGVENPNMGPALTAMGVTTFASDASRQPNPYALGTALSAPRYPSNIYYNAGNWADELNEYNTLYTAAGVSLGDTNAPSAVGHCANTSSTTCLAVPATQATLLASESRIEMSHILANNPRVGYAHQTNLIGPAATGYTLLGFLDNVLSQYNSYAKEPVTQVTDATEAQILVQQAAWSAARTAGTVTATEANGVISVVNNGTTPVSAPITVPTSTTVNGAAFGQPYGGSLSGWTTVAPGATVVLNAPIAAPAITSAATATATAGAPFTFTVTTTGTPIPAISQSGLLPAGLVFTDHHDGTATLSGTPVAGSGGSYPLALGATNSAATASQTFTLTVAAGPVITSAPAATSVVGIPFAFTVTTSGTTTATLTEAGSLPSGLSFTANANGTATLAGTAGAGSGGSYSLTLTATSTLGTTSQVLVLTNAEAPSITSPATVAFTTGTAGSYQVTTTGYPAAAITEAGKLPAGLTFIDNGNGTAAIAGTPAAASAGAYPVAITATNATAVSAVTLNLAITVSTVISPVITSAPSAFFTAGVAGAVAVIATGTPTPVLAESGALPTGLTFTDNGNGSALLSGTTLQAGTFNLIMTATNVTNGTTNTVTQPYSLIVGQGPAFTSPATASASAGTPFSLTITTTGYPLPSIGESGTLPAGLSFADSGNGTATVTGTPASGTAGAYPVTLTAVNGTGAATQALVVTVAGTMAITSPATATGTVLSPLSFTVTTSGASAPVLTETGNLPGGVTFVDHGNGTATLAGTPATGTAGSYAVTIGATSGTASATQAFTVTIIDVAVIPPIAPVITTAKTSTFTAGQSGSFLVATTGFPPAVLTVAGGLPSGVTFMSNANGTATLSGTASATGVGTWPLTITAANTGGTVTQAFSLVIISGSLVITSPASVTATGGTKLSFTVTATGTSTPTVTERGTLPAGVVFAPGANGTATLSGTPTAAASGTYPLTFTATNLSGTTSQAFTLTVSQLPTITSAATLTETAGSPFSFSVTSKAYPAAALTLSGPVPAGLAFIDNANGTATISGTAAAAGTFALMVQATNPAGAASQSLTLTVLAAAKPGTLVPVFTSAASLTATTGKAFTFAVTTAASAQGTTVTTRLTRSGTLPAGVAFANAGNGTGVLLGIPGKASSGVYLVTFTATNGAGTTTQSFTLTISGAPTMTSAATATATVGVPFSFTVLTSGSPAPALTESGTLPAGFTFVDNGNGTATMSGTASIAGGGAFPITITTKNTVGSGTQAFVLTVRQPPVITSAATATATHGVAFSFTFAATGYPLASVTHSGAVGGLVYSNKGNGTATLTGTPTRAGTYNVTINAKNTSGTVTQSFVLTVL
jgi:hypothetical protein